MVDSLHIIGQQISAALASSPLLKSTMIDGIQRRISEPLHLKHLLKSIIQDPDALASVARRSYAHTNGFDKIVLVTSNAPEFKLRLHMWDAGDSSSRGDVDVHNHRWDFVSVVLLGSLTWEEYAITQDAKDKAEYVEYEYRSPEGREEFPIVPVGTARLAVLQTGIKLAGTSYKLHHEVLHRTWPDQGTTATLLIQGPTIRGRTRVFRSVELVTRGGIQEVSVPYHSPQSLKRKLENFVDQF